MRKSVWILFFAVYFLFIPRALADAVYLSNGDIVKGVVVEDHKDRIVLSTYKGEIQILKVTIDQIFFDNEEQNYTYLGDKALSEGDFALAFGLYQKALQINPEFENAKGAFLRLNDAINRKKLNIKPHNFSAALSEQLGISIERFKDRIRVKSVINESTAQKAGISEGDFITTVWDASIMYMDADSAAENITGAPLSIVNLGIEKNITLPVTPIPWYKKILSFLMFDNFGFKLALRSNGLIVSYINPRGPAAANGLKSSDEATHINGESVRYMPISMVRRKIFQSNLNEVILTVKRQIVVMRAGK